MYGGIIQQPPKLMGICPEIFSAHRSRMIPTSTKRLVGRVVAPLCLLLFFIFYILSDSGSRLFNAPSKWEASSNAFESSYEADELRPVESEVQGLGPWPRKIWQTGSEAMKKQWKKQVQTWTNLNPGWEYGFLSDDGSSQYVEEHFSEHTTIHNFWRELNVTILRADLIRYLAMLADGGVYSDMDTSCLKPIGDWIPPEFSESEIGIVAGIEYDDNTYPMFARPISICQWTLMARPGHAVFEKVVARVIYHLEYLARIKHVQLSELKLNKKEVLDATGPGAFTDSIMEVISEHERRKVSWKELSQLKQAKLFGDVLILPVNAFAGNQKHSHSGRPEFGPKLVTHHFGRSWYKRPEDVPKKTEPMKTKKEDLFETHRSQRGHRLQS